MINIPTYTKDKINFLFIIGLIHFTLSLPVFAQEQSDSAKYIRSIQIHRENVFPDSLEKNSFIYGLANDLHVVTKENVVRNELLFKEGDSLDQDITAETERNLRQLDFLDENRIRIDTVAIDSVDIHIYTQDQWSTVVSYIVESGGGYTQLGGSIEEVNFLGLGKMLYAEGIHESDVGWAWSFLYDDPQLFGSRWKSYAGFSTGPLLNSIKASIYRPYISIDTRWAGGFGGYYWDETQRLFHKGIEISRLKYKTEGAYINVSRAFGKRYRRRSIEIGFDYQKREFKPIEGQTTTPLPDDELIMATSLTGSLENIKYVKTKQINRFRRTEDLKMGWVADVTVTRVGFPVAKGEKRWEVDLEYRHAFQLFKSHFLFSYIGYQTQFFKNTIGRFMLRYYAKIFPMQTWAFNMQWKVADELEESRQFLLGGNSGLRGFRAREFSGDKKFVMNLENRIFTSINLFTLSFGGVVFFDAGHVWKRTQRINLKQINYSVGFGLRIGFTKGAGAPVMRIDFGYPLSEKRGLGISFGVGQVF